MVVALLPKYPSYSFMLPCLLKPGSNPAHAEAPMTVDPLDIPTMHLCSGMSLLFCSGLFQNKFL